eukprot:scaffold35220_cov34-Tisochrysis_lutea.AAC.3
MRLGPGNTVLAPTKSCAICGIQAQRETPRPSGSSSNFMWRLQNRLPLTAQEDEASLTAKQKDEGHHRHEDLVHVAVRLAQVEGEHVIAVAQTSLPTKIGAVSPHGKESGKHCGTMAPVVEEVGCTNAKQSRNPNIRVRLERRY